MYGAGLEDNEETRRAIRVSDIEGNMLQFSMNNPIFSFGELAAPENYNRLAFRNNFPSQEELKSCLDSLIEEGSFREVGKDKYSAEWGKD